VTLKKQDFEQVFRFCKTAECCLDPEPELEPEPEPEPEQEPEQQPKPQQIIKVSQHCMLLRIRFIVICRCSPASTPAGCSENATKFTFTAFGITCKMSALDQINILNSSSNFTGSQAASCMQLHRKNCNCKVSEEGY
jgi:hypothetical protein